MMTMNHLSKTTTPLVWFWLIPAVIVILIIVAVTLRLRQAKKMRVGDQRVLDTKHHTNKRVNNRFVRTIGRAGKRNSLFGLVQHTGRKSGNQYTTPVRLIRHDQEFIIPLTHGERSDWYQNLRAAGRMEVQWQGAIYPVEYVELLEPSQVMDSFPLVSRILFRQEGVSAFVRVKMI